ncbi:MAG: class I SAM-dependent methyltransferase [Acidobacteriota bacterium]
MSASAAELPHRACPACQAPPGAHVRLGAYSRSEWSIVRCERCRLVFLANPPSYAELATEHEWRHAYRKERSRRREDRPAYYAVSDSIKRARKALRRALGRGLRKDVAAIIAAAPDGGRVLDVGCSNGPTLRQLPDRYTPFGVEISPILGAESDVLCRARGGHVEICDALAGLERFGDATFTVVSMESYLEHETRPRDVLAQVRRVLAPGGKLVVKVPNFGSLNRRLRGADWPGFRFPDHVSYFTPTTLRDAMLRAGLEIDRFRLIDRLPTSDNMWLIARRPS